MLQVDNDDEWNGTAHPSLPVKGRSSTTRLESVYEGETGRVFFQVLE